MLESVRNLLHQGDNAILLSCVMLIAIAVLTVVTIVTAWRLSVVNRRIASMTRGANNISLEEMIVDCLSKVEHTERRIDSVEQAVGVIQAQIPRCIQRANMIRFDAFEDVGGQQSFSIALLDAIGDGVIITSMYSRTEIRVYAKSIHGGRASHQLSDEEARVLRETL